MSAVRGIYRDGKIELRTPPPDWEVGAEVEVGLPHYERLPW